jgi:cell division protein FtsA
MITIPGICGRDPRVISFKLLANIIEARMEEIIEAVMFEVERSGYADKLAAGIVITGGGAMMKDLPQFVKFKTGMDIRIGKPIYLTGDSNLDTKRCSYSTIIGLLMRGFEYAEVPDLQTASSQLIEPIVVKTEPTSKWRNIRKEKETKKEAKKENSTNETSIEKNNKGGFMGGLFDRIPDFFGPADNNV